MEPPHPLPYLESVYWEPQHRFYLLICTICTIYFLLPSGVYILYCTHIAGLLILCLVVHTRLEAVANLWVRYGAPAGLHRG